MIERREVCVPAHRERGRVDEGGQPKEATGIKEGTSRSSNPCEILIVPLTEVILCGRDLNQIWFHHIEVLTCGRHGRGGVYPKNAKMTRWRDP